MAFIRFSTPYHGHKAMVMSRPKALELKRAMQHPETATAAQKSFIQHVDKVYLGKDHNQAILEANANPVTHWSEREQKELEL